jgi:hypothetical protein
MAARRHDDRAGRDHDSAGRHDGWPAWRDDGAARAGAAGAVDATGADDGVGGGDVSDDHAEGEEAEKNFFHGRFLCLDAPFLLGQAERSANLARPACTMGEPRDTRITLARAFMNLPQGALTARAWRFRPIFR